MKDTPYDFAGWVTKNDIKVSDGVIIKHNAFQGNDGSSVPLVWNHNHSSADNVLGNIELINHSEGVYGYGRFNDSPMATHAKELLTHGDINAMSIGANRIKRQGANVVHGNIFEVSLVLAGANPGATIEEVISHTDGESAAVIYTDELIHADDSELSQNEGETPMNAETALDILQNASDESLISVNNVMASLSELNHSADESDLEVALAPLSDEEVEALATLLDQGLLQGAPGEEADENINHNDPAENSVVPKPEGDEQMSHNLFSGAEDNTSTISHSEIQATFNDAQKFGTLKESMLQHGITNIEDLFPDAKAVTGLEVLKDTKTQATAILSGTRKSPFSRIKTRYADLTSADARAKGYIKGNEKLEQIFPVLSRVTTPQTVYKKQKLDRDDIVDITDFDIVSFMNSEMRMMLDEEIARAVLVGDGRPVLVNGQPNPDKINADNIRPIIADDALYTIQETATSINTLVDELVLVRGQLQGSGSETLFINPNTLAVLKLLKDNQGRYLYGNGIPSVDVIRSIIGVSNIIETTFVPENSALLGNLNDYVLGATAGGQVTTFDDFDIDYNQYKYLIETRLVGAIDKPKAFAYVTLSTPSN